SWHPLGRCLFGAAKVGSHRRGRLFGAAEAGSSLGGCLFGLGSAAIEDVGVLG
nr:hypothetical protein [Tanacetum cinerariifolium]